MLAEVVDLQIERRVVPVAIEPRLADGHHLRVIGQRQDVVEPQIPLLVGRMGMGADGAIDVVMSFGDDAEALKIANGTDYGLVSGVFTRNIDHATSVAKDIRAGQVFVNEWFAGGVETPFGGYGKSGYGREKGREALLNYVQTKNVAIKLGK